VSDKPLPRVASPNRTQLLLEPVDLDGRLPADHPARSIWEFVERFDLSAYYDEIKAVEGEPGRPAIDPKILVALWLYATSEGVGSARELARLCEAHDAYRWICGGVSVNHHTLSDFRVGHEEKLDELFTQVLAVLMADGLVTLSRVAQDGTRVRASAGAASFHRQKRLRKCLKLAREQLRQVKKQDDGSVTAREQAARERAARERKERVEHALKELKQVQATKQTEKEKEKARSSSTDPEARVMKMPDGGFRPAFNLQLATTTEEKVIVGVEVINAGTDQGQAQPMLEQIEQRTGERPSEVLLDGGYVKLQDIEAIQQAGTTVYAPEPKHRDGSAGGVPRAGDSKEITKWRKRMTSPKGKAIYQERGETAELVNAQFKETLGLKLRVRGIRKVMCIALWCAIAHNLLRWLALSSWQA
jgi:transposase